MMLISTVILLCILSMRSAGLPHHFPSREILKLLFPVSVGIPWRYTEAQCIIPRGVLLRHTLVSGLPKAENQSGTLLFMNYSTCMDIQKIQWHEQQMNMFQLNT